MPRNHYREQSDATVRLGEIRVPRTGPRAAVPRPRQRMSAPGVILPAPAPDASPYVDAGPDTHARTHADCPARTHAEPLRSDRG